MSNPTPPPAQPQAPKDYSKPERLCDIVMKGGITSGVIYPAAVCELATAYSFKNIGGASAGAIAAAMTAAAEYARRKGNAGAASKGGFKRLEELPEVLATGLSTLFQPNRSTEPLFAMLNAGLDMDDALPALNKAALPVLNKAMTVSRALAVNFPKGAALGMLPGLFLCLVLGLAALWVWAASGERSALWWCGFVGLFGSGLLFAILLTILFRASGAAAHLISRAASALPENYFGLCNGMKDLPSRHKPLTEWLADEIDRIAGKNDPRKPLTFGDLEGATSPLESDLPPEERGINLEMMTTNLTLGRPYRLPSFGGSREFFFNPEEFRMLFPERIVDWMVESSRKLQPKDERQALEWASFSPRLKVPPPEDWPVVVATRMSLSFPVLLSAVPLHMVDRTRGVRKEPGDTGQQSEETRPEGSPESVIDYSLPQLEKCWFSDGGICSNFPIHFFDRPLPRWPTFGINLRPVNPTYHRDGQPEEEKVYLVKDNRGGLTPMWDRFDQKKSGIDKLTGFVGAIVNTMYNWSDNLQTTVPGYRDRVVHIHHTDKEGGLNLNMKKETIEALSARGACAGEMLRKRFTGQDEASDLSWESHRWTRYRTMMSLLEKVMSDLRRAYRYTRPGDAPYPELIQPASGKPAKHYLMSVKQRDFARAETEQLIAAVDRWETQGQTFRDEKIPTPEPEFRVRPNV
jgi:predicted acylesterase/phospholipase RssA